MMDYIGICWIIGDIPDRRTSCLSCIGEKDLLCLQLCIEDWKNFAQISFHLHTFQTSFLTHYQYASRSTYLRYSDIMISSLAT